MFSKILHGQFPLKEMFWKYGLWGLFIQVFMMYLVRIFLLHSLKGMKLPTYYKTVFSLINMDTTILVLTVIYFSLLFFLGFYSIILTFGIWRSAKEYDKSVWLIRLAKFSTLLLIFCAFKIVV